MKRTEVRANIPYATKDNYGYVNTGEHQIVVVLALEPWRQDQSDGSNYRLSAWPARRRFTTPAGFPALKFRAATIPNPEYIEDCEIRSRVREEVQQAAGYTYGDIRFQPTIPHPEGAWEAYPVVVEPRHLHAPLDEYLAQRDAAIAKRDAEDAARLEREAAREAAREAELAAQRAVYAAEINARRPRVEALTDVLPLSNTQITWLARDQATPVDLDWLEALATRLRAARVPS